MLQYETKTLTVPYVKISFSLAVSIYILLLTYEPLHVTVKYVCDKICRLITFTPKQQSLEVNHSRIINTNNAKPSRFIFYAEAITYLNFLICKILLLKHLNNHLTVYFFTLHGCKSEWAYFKTSRCDWKWHFSHIFVKSSLIYLVSK